MPEKVFKAYNGPYPTSAQQLAVTSGTSIKTMMQLSTPATKGITIVGWGILHDGHASCTSASAELMIVEDAATVTAYAAGDFTQMSGPNDEGSLLTLGTANSGYTSTAENSGSFAGVDVLDSVYLTPTLADRHVHYWQLGREPYMQVSKFLRVRVTMAGNATNVRCWVEWSE